MSLYRSSAVAMPGTRASGCLAWQRPGLSKSHISPSHKLASVEFFKGASFLSVRLETDAPLQSKPPKRGEVNEFSAASRRRMLDLLAKIEVSQVPLFVTLTYPDSFPLYSEEFKRHLEMFCARLQRRWPQAAVIWKLEFKERKSGESKGKVAPHYHLFVYGVPWEFPWRLESRSHYRVVSELHGRELPFPLLLVLEHGQIQDLFGGAVTLGSDRDRVQSASIECLDNFTLWVSRTWYDVVNAGDIRHFRAGTRVERLRTVKGAFAYAAKGYIGKSEAMPILERKPGRFWGVINRKSLKLGERQHFEVTEKQAVQLRRFIRRYRRAKTPPEKRRWLFKGGLCSKEFSVKLYCNVDFWLERLPWLLGNFPCNFSEKGVLSG